MHYGPSNEESASGGFPKLTELQIAFSRDGFHWDRSNRQTFIGATLKRDSWERAYIHSTGGVCNIVGDELYFYYTAFRGDENKKYFKGTVAFDNECKGMYANAAVGLATLRRDGFASMGAGSAEKTLLTRPVTFSGSHLFVNIDAPEGKLSVEVCGIDGEPLPGFEMRNCVAASGDSTRQSIRWVGNSDLRQHAGKPVRLRFYVTNGRLYSFWVSKTAEGKSGGAMAAGGPGISGTWDA